MWTITPYEFLQWYDVVNATYPTSLRSNQDQAHHCRLTAQGIAKVKANKTDHKLTLVPDEDYGIEHGRNEGHTFDGYWVALSVESPFRASFVLQKRRRPIVPKLEEI